MLCGLGVARDDPADVREEVGEGGVESVPRQVCMQGLVDDLQVCGGVVGSLPMCGGTLQVWGACVGVLGLEYDQGGGEPLARSRGGGGLDSPGRTVELVEGKVV